MENIAPSDGHTLVEVMSDETGERFTLRVLNAHASLGETLFVEYPGGRRVPFVVVSILQ